MGGGQLPDLQNIIQDGIPDNSLVWIRYLGDDPQDWADYQGLPPQGGPLSSGDEATARHNGLVGLPAFGGGDVRIGYRGGGYILPPPKEYHSPVHHDSSDTEAVSGGGVADRSTSVTAVVGEGWYIPGGREGNDEGDVGGVGG